jgi:hypothetical protein
MKRRDKIQIERLKQLEAEFSELLIPCLQQCSHGRWGLFGAYDRFPEIEAWPEFERVRGLAISIRAIRAASGERNELCEEFLGLSKFHRPNDPGEPKLAKAFLERIEKQHA